GVSAAEFAASPGTKEHVVFGSDLQGPDRVFAELVAEFYPSVGEVAVQAAPVVQGVARGVQAEAGEDGFFDDFMAVPAFEAAVVFTFGRFALSFFFGVSLRFLRVVSRGGVELSRVESFKKKYA
ncbi:MAG: hypothetical protein ACJAVK_002419, partial [Akkermansiaceae bacterium]